ncbi:hypothetical protein [Streptomyces sp. TRM64462]|nr:hypothetical protein [Streptomyces sp. TRM64462]
MTPALTTRPVTRSVPPAATAPGARRAHRRAGRRTAAVPGESR